MNELKQLYEVTEYDNLLCQIIAAVKGTRRIPKYIRRLSRSKYGEKNNLARYFMHKYSGISVGKYTYGFERYFYQAESLASIGSFCSIAENVNLTKGNHPLHCITTHPIVYLKQFGMLNEDRSNLHSNQKIIIGNDVWIGRDVTLLPGIKIGNGTVIGAGAVVSKDIPDYAIAVGVPARVIKYRFSKENIQRLNELNWWDWSDTQIRNNIELLIDPEKFFKQKS